MREKELLVFQEAIASLKSAAAYTASDLYALLDMCSDNAFIALIHSEGDPITAWRAAAKEFFSNRSDRVLAESFILGYGKTDLSGLMSYIAFFEQKIQAALSEAKQDVSLKCRLYTTLGLFSGAAAALILL